MIVNVVSTETVAHCPKGSWAASHYRPDGGHCYCFTADGAGPISPAGRRLLQLSQTSQRAEIRAAAYRLRLQHNLEALPEADRLVVLGRLAEPDGGTNA